MLFLLKSSTSRALAVAGYFFFRIASSASKIEWFAPQHNKQKDRKLCCMLYLNGHT